MFGKSLASAVLLATTLSANAFNLALAPCINGDVSSAGNFPGQSMGDQIYAYLDWRPYEPYHLFAVAANYIGLPFHEDDRSSQQR